MSEIKKEFKMPERTKEGEFHLQVYCLRRDLRKIQVQLNWVASDEIYWKGQAEDISQQVSSLEKEKKELEEKIEKLKADNRMWGWMHSQLAEDRKKCFGLEH